MAPVLSDLSSLPLGLLSPGPLLALLRDQAEQHPRGPHFVQGTYQDNSKSHFLGIISPRFVSRQDTNPCVCECACACACVCVHLCVSICWNLHLAGCKHGIAPVHTRGRTPAAPPRAFPLTLPPAGSSLYPCFPNVESGLMTHSLTQMGFLSPGFYAEPSLGVCVGCIQGTKNQEVKGVEAL